MHDPTAPVRRDRWLWAARFFKTRGLAVEAVTGGRVHLNGQRTKPSKDVRPGDELEVTFGQATVTAIVKATAERRGPTAEAKLLYEETPESLEAKERRAEQRRLAPPPVAPGGARPTKRDRRRLDARRGRT